MPAKKNAPVASPCEANKATPKSGNDLRDSPAVPALDAFCRAALDDAETPMVGLAEFPLEAAFRREMNQARYADLRQTLATCTPQDLKNAAGLEGTQARLVRLRALLARHAGKHAGAIEKQVYGAQVGVYAAALEDQRFDPAREAIHISLGNPPPSAPPASWCAPEAVATEPGPAKDAPADDFPPSGWIRHAKAAKKLSAEMDGTITSNQAKVILTRAAKGGKLEVWRNPVKNAVFLEPGSLSTLILEMRNRALEEDPE